MQNHIAVFWDYENCRPPSSLSGYILVERIRRLVREFGVITLFKAYVDLTSECTNAKSLTLHSELQSSGLSLTHCPHNGRKDVADKIMLVDMLAFAIDRRPPATIVLITGDRDFTYAVSILKLRGYEVVVIVPHTIAHLSLKVQAGRLFEWQRDVIGSSVVEPLSSLAGDADLPPRMDGVIGARARPELMSSMCPPWPASASHVYSSRTGHCSETSPSKRPSWDDLYSNNSPKAELPPSSDSMQVRSTRAYLPDFGPNRDNDASHEHGLVIEDGPGEYPSSKQIPPSMISTSDKWLETCSPARTQALLGEALGRHEEKRRPASPSSIFRKTPNPSCATWPEGTAIIASRPGSDPQLSSRPYLDADRCSSPFRSSFVYNSSEGSIASNVALSDSGLRFDVHSPLNSLNSPDSELSGLGAPTHIGRTVPQDEPLSEARLSKLKDPAINPFETSKPPAQLIQSRPALSDSLIPKDPLDFNEPSGLHVVAIEGKENVLPRSGPPNYEHETTDINLTCTTPLSEEALSLPYAPNPLPFHYKFEELVSLFVFKRALKGTTRIRSAEVAAELLKRDPEVYAKAGVYKWKQYVEEARRANVVVSPGLDVYGNSWVEISPCLYPNLQVLHPETNVLQYKSPIIVKPVPSADEVPEIFEPLVTILRSEIPSHRMLFSRLGERLKSQFQYVYEEAGVRGLSSYLEKAVKCNLVRLGGINTPGRQWVELMEGFVQNA
ncbi:hypothetical protein M0805_003060 [Coniferiporia weirii]|nr:hypothetical protein M0805_003060 [Coniferiporia weirii]